MADPKTDDELALEASAVAERANAYAAANIPQGAPFDDTYRAMEAEFTRLYQTLLARGQPRRERATAPRAPRAESRSRYAIGPAAIAAGKLPDKAPVVSSATNQLYQKKFDALHAHAVAGEWDAVRDFKITGSNSYSKMVERYRQDLLAVHKAQAEASAATGQC